MRELNAGDMTGLVIEPNKAVLFITRERYADAIPILEEAPAQAPAFEKAGKALELCRGKLQG